MPDSSAWTAIGVIVAAVSFVMSIATTSGAHWRSLEGQARQTIERLVSRDVAHARAIVRRAARTGKLGAAALAEFEEAALLLMATVQSVELHVRLIKRTATIATEAKVIYRLVTAVVDDLRPALVKHGDRIEWKDAGELTNDVIEAMPRVRNEWGRKVAEPPTLRLPV